MSDNKQKKRGLGRGLSALMADVEPETTRAMHGGTAQSGQKIAIERIHPNPDQPRRQFNEQDLADLTSSIAQKGVIQPLIVRPRSGDSFEIVAGERRWRAAQRANLHELPVIVRDFDDTEVLEIAIIENIQRADLNPIEEAAGYRQLMDKFGHTQEQMAEALGKSRSHIANLLRLLNLPQGILQLVQEGALSAGHARALLTSSSPDNLAKKIISEGWSVRMTERAVKKEGEPAKQPKASGAISSEKDSDTRALEADLSAAIGLKVSVEHKQGQERGKLVINYPDLESLDRLCGLLSR